MSIILKLLFALFLAILVGAPIGYIAYGSHQGGGSPTSGTGGSTHAVPGPLAGAGLPVIAIGYGVYWLVKRRRRAN
jgi:hypothetical protein